MYTDLEEKFPRETICDVMRLAVVSFYSEHNISKPLSSVRGVRLASLLLFADPFYVGESKDPIQDSEEG